MPELLTPELERLRATATELAAGPLADLRERDDLDHAGLRSVVAAASKEAGIFGLAQPRSVGGSGASTLALTVVRDVLGAHDVAHLPGILGPAPGLLAGVGEPLRSDYLEPLLAGAKQGGFAFTERPDAPRPTWAVVDGDALVVNGEKSYVTGGGDADFVSTLVEVDGEGPAMVVIDTALAGVELVRRFESLDGSHHAAFRFAGVRVPRSHVVGEAGRGTGRALVQVSQVRMAIAATCVGLTRCVVDLVGEHLRAPRRDGRTLGDSERHRLRYGEMRILAYGARSALYRTARLVDSGDNAVNECIAAKYLATEVVGGVVDAAIQAVGGEALVVGHPLESIHRRVRSMRLAEGASDVLCVNAARGWLDLDKGRI